MGSAQLDRPTTPEPAHRSEPHQTLDHVIKAVKPRLRGWLHAGMAPLALAAGIVLVALAPTSAGKIGGAVFLAASACCCSAPAASTTAAPGVRAARASCAGWTTPTSTSSSPRPTPRWR